MPCDSHKTILVPNRLTLSFSHLNSRMARTKVPQRRAVRSQAGRSRPGPKCTWSQHLQHWWNSHSTSTRNLSQSGGDEQKDRGGRVTGTGGEVTGVITNPTVGPDDYGGWAIYVRRGGTSLQEALTYHGRQSPPEVNSCMLHSWRSPESIDQGQWLFGRSTSFKEHRAPHSEKALLMASPQDSPRSGQIWPVLPSTCHLVFAGRCGGIFGWAHGRLEPLCHTC